MIHVIKHDMDPNSNINYRRKIAPKYVFMKDNILSLNQYRKNPPLSDESLTKDCPWYVVCRSTTAAFTKPCDVFWQ